MVYNDEMELLKSMQSGNTSAFSIIYDRYQPLLHLEAFYKVYNHEEAEDITHEVLAALWERRESIDISFSLRSYLFKAVHFQYVWRLRKKQSHTKFVSNQKMLTEEVPAERLEKKELLHHLRNAIENIPSVASRNVVRLAYLHQMSHLEVAAHLGMQVVNVRNQSSRGIKMLRSLFKRSRK